jgi:putative endonuclease
MRVVARNYRTRSGHGEIDLIAWDGETLVFVEVKSRHSDEFGDPDRNVDREKRRALLRAGFEYARHAGVSWDQVRLDIVTVLLTDPPALTHFRSAFQSTPTL